MSVYTVLVVLVGLARIAAQGMMWDYGDAWSRDIPCKDHFKDPIEKIDKVATTTVKSGPYGTDMDYGLTRDKGHFFENDLWFCPDKTEVQNKPIDVYRCADRDEKTCLQKEEKIGTTLMRMNVCRDTFLKGNFENKVKTCMPWEDGGFMTHLRVQFTSIPALWKWDAITPVKPTEVRVLKCVSSVDKISFTNIACWYDNIENYVFLKPRYRFNFMESTNAQTCVVSHDKTSGTVSYATDVLKYKLQDLIKIYTYCQFWAKDPRGDWLKYTGSPLWFAIPEIKQQKKIHFYDYSLDRITAPCTDFVTKPCFDNAFSFSAQMCLWADKATKIKPLSLQDLIAKYPASETVDFQNYGESFYEMNLANKNIEVFVQVTDGQKYDNWNGGAKKLTSSSRLYVVLKPDFSCSGCTVNGQALSGDQVCGVPHKCKMCGGGQRVNQNLEWSPCVPSYPIRICKDCSLHQNRSSNEFDCVACPRLWPMRRVGEEKCTECEHTQYFDAGTASGCLYLKSVADGLSFDSGVFFNGASYDEYMPTGADKPNAVRALYYRDLLTSGNAWNSSTRASRCESTEFPNVNYSVTDVLTRNMDSTRVQYRSWCGHVEILRSANAQLRLVQCVQSVKPVASAESMFVEPDRTLSLRDLLTYANMKGYALKYERNHVERAGIKSVTEVTLTANGAYRECQYEIRREGRTDDCTVCTGTDYTKDCGPTYNDELPVPAQPGNGSCARCETRCYDSDSFFAVERLSCWSNGTRRVSASDATWHGCLDKIKATMAPYRNYWYKTAPCKKCAKLRDVGGVPWLVTRCGNTALFETWHPTLEEVIGIDTRPRRRLCCAMDNALLVSSQYNSNLNTRCVEFESTGLNSEAAARSLLVSPSSGTPLCSIFVADLETQVSAFCPSGWFVDKSAPGCLGPLDVWNHACCSKCKACEGEGKIKTSDYMTCPGNTVRDTQWTACITTCAEKNYQVNDTCIACESCS